MGDISFNFTFDEYINKLYTYLCCNMTEEQHKNEYVVCYDYTENDVMNNIAYFKQCYRNELSPNKALLFFYDYLIEKKYGI